MEFHCSRSCLILKVKRIELFWSRGYNPNKGAFIWNRDVDGQRQFEVGGLNWMFRVLWEYNPNWPWDRKHKFFRCLCGSKFSSPPSRELHMRKCEKVPKENVYMCNCGKLFIGKMNRDFHFFRCSSNPGNKKS